MSLQQGTTEHQGQAASAPPAADLGLYAAHVQELVLFLRDEGHVLSSMDQHILEGWWRAGYPLEVVLHTVRERGLRLKARKNPPRGLPLRSLSRYVQKAGESALAKSVGGHSCGGVVVVPAESDSQQRLSVMLSGLEADLCDAIALRDGSDSSHSLLAELLGELEEIQSKGHGTAALFSTLLAMGRRYYDGLWRGASVQEQRDLRADVLASLGESAGPMSADALEETVTELCRRALRRQDPLFDPDRYWRGL